MRNQVERKKGCIRDSSSRNTSSITSRSRRNSGTAVQFFSLSRILMAAQTRAYFSVAKVGGRGIGMLAHAERFDAGRAEQIHVFAPRGHMDLRSEEHTSELQSQFH